MSTNENEYFLNWKPQLSRQSEAREKPGRRVLVIDDDLDLCELLAQYLKPEGFLVEMSHKGDEGVERALASEFALIVLDVMLPGMKGYEVLQRIRVHSSVPVLMLTARGDGDDRILGLEIGADDYVPKPFDPRELLARIRALLRRSAGTAGAAPPEQFAAGDVALDGASRTVRCGDRTTELTAVEFALLTQLLKEPGRVVSREELVKQLLVREFSPGDRSIDAHISNLRRKLGPASDGEERIREVRNVGYLFAKPRAV